MKRPVPFHPNLVWPPAVLIGLFISIYCLVSVCFWLVDRSVPGTTMSTFENDQLIEFRAVILGFAAGIYAAFRLWRFHPACNRAYAGWLKLSPWTPAHPLPAGPAHIVWQDAAVVGALTVIAIWHHVYAWFPVTVFILVYLALFTLLLALTRQWGPCLALGFLWPSFALLPALILPHVTGMILAMSGILAAIVCVTWYGHRQSLKAFPWEFIKLERSSLRRVDRIQALATPSAAGTQYNLGWPYLMLSPKVRPPAISRRTNLALSTLAGWWSFCIFCFMRAAGADPMPGGVILFFSIIAALVRLAIYAGGVAAPFNIRGRIATGRIVVPGFDKVFVTPLAVVAAAIIGSIVINHSGAWYPVTESIVIAVLCWTLLGGGPTLRSWALTGQFRIRPPVVINANKQLIKQV